MPQTMKLALLDDYQKVALRMADWDRLRKRGIEISVFHEPFKSVDDAAAKLAPFDILGLLRERTAFRIDEYKFEGGEDGRGIFTLLAGGMRTVTGLIGRAAGQRGNYAVNTPTSTIGIRGTDFVVIVGAAGV